MQKKRRLSYFINPAVQYKFIFLICLSTLLPLATTFWVLYVVISSVIHDTQTQNELAYFVLLFVSRKIYMILSIGFLAITLLILCWAILFIHRIVGPLYRLEKEIDKVIKGEKTPSLTLRKHDHYGSLAHKINLLIEKATQQ